MLAMNQHLAKSFFEARERKGLTMREVAEIAGVSYQTVFNAEHGRVKLSTVQKISRALGLSASGTVRAAQSDVAAYLLTA